MAKVYIQEFEVEGSGNFPFDMLRYDFCSPVREGTDTANMEAPIYDRDKLPHRRIKLKRYVFNKASYPTSNRWKSLGWKVVEESVYTREV